MKKLALVLIVIMFAAGFAIAQDDTAATEVTGADELVKQKSSQWGGVWILSLIHISEPTRPTATSRMPSSA